MSYAGPESRARTGRPASRPNAGAPAAARPAGGSRPSALRPLLSRQELYESRDEGGGAPWRQVAVFGAGLLIGIAVGAGAALLAAPQTGAETRAALAARVARARRATSRRGHDAWDDLRLELRSAKRMLRRRKARRALEAESEEA